MTLSTTTAARFDQPAAAASSGANAPAARRGFRTESARSGPSSKVAHGCDHHVLAPAAGDHSPDRIFFATFFD